MNRRGLFTIVLLLAIFAYPPHWYPQPVRLKFTEWFGASEFRALPESIPAVASEPDLFCPPDPEGWRGPQSIEGLEITDAK